MGRLDRVGRNEAGTPWLGGEAAGTLDVTADVGRAATARKEFEVIASSVLTADDVFVTAEGYEQLCSELEALRTVRRAEMAEHLRDARAVSDPDNQALFDLLEGQAQLEQRIGLLEAQLAAARVVEPASDGSAGIGSWVRVRHADSGDVAEYELVGLIESDVGSGRVSVGAPVGRALVGGRRGETVPVETPCGTLHLEILSVSSARRPMRAAA